MDPLSVIKSRQQAMWAAGDYAAVATPLVIVAEELCEAMDLRAGSRVLDVATGSGNAALAAARRRCDVTGIDFVPQLLERARERAAVERLEVRFVEGDAEQLGFPDGAFHYVVSTFGVMFAPDQERVANELVRVCRKGGRIGLASWTPEGFVGEWFRATARRAPPPPGLRPPLAWGSEARLRELFAGGVAFLETRRRSFVFRYRSSAHWLEFFRTQFGPTRQAFEKLDASAAEDFAGELLELLARHNRSGDETLAVPGEYLEALITV